MRKSLWDGRVEDFEEGDVIIATCKRCKRVGYVPQEAVRAKITNDYRRPWAIHDWTKVKDLRFNLRCLTCSPRPLKALKHAEIDIMVQNDGDRVRRK